LGLILSIMMLTIIALLGASWFFWKRPDGRRQALLMLVLAAVIAANVAILTVPGPDGTAPAASTPIE